MTYSSSDDAAWQARYERIYVPIASALERLCDQYGWDEVLGIFSSDVPRYFTPREREERHKHALRAAQRREHHQKKPPRGRHPAQSQENRQ